MRNTVLFSVMFSAVIFFCVAVQEETLSAFSSASSPLPPQAGVPETVVVPPSQIVPPPSLPTRATPTRLSIPSIKLKASIVGVGITPEGEMDVPNGKSKNVGWYTGGVTPGEVGSAVLDAHVYAAFGNLRRVQPGDDIYVTNNDGETLHFKVEEAKLTNLKDVSTYFLFERADKPRLNLITCAGKFDKKLNTYTHRLIVYAVLVD